MREINFAARFIILILTNGTSSETTSTQNVAVISTNTTHGWTSVTDSSQNPTVPPTRLFLLVKYAIRHPYGVDSAII